MLFRRRRHVAITLARACATLRAIADIVACSFAQIRFQKL